jgi:hypothetical protein
VAEKRLMEREGFDLPESRQAEDLPPGGPLWAPAPKPNAKVPPVKPKPSTSTTAPPREAAPEPADEEGPPPPPTTSTTSPPPERRPPPREDPLPFPFPRG